MNERKIRWGILSTGRIAKKFTQGLQVLPDAEVLAVGSRTQEGADTFGEELNIPRRYGSYEQLVQDPDVEVIYVATPHPMHKADSLLCLQAGKAVLCEKPLTLNERDSQALIDFARRHNLFLMEAMWTRCFPLMAQVREWLRAGRIGEVRMLTADFGFCAEFNPQSRLFAPELGGGALLDVGVYPIALAQMVFGTPETITGAAHIGQTGVDEQNAILLTYTGGRMAMLSSAVRLTTPHEAIITGTEGIIRIHDPWWKPTRLTLTQPGQEPQHHEFPREGNGMNYEAAHVMQCLREDRTESEIMPHSETLAIMRTMDTLRAQWGVQYPGE
jgi:predicted dehydrogenase